MVGGPIFGLFILGLFVPFVDDVAAWAALSAGTGLSAWLYIGRTLTEVRPFIVFSKVLSKG